MSDTFVDAVLSGDALMRDIDDWIDRWHDDPDRSDEIFEYLGLSWPQYQTWTERPESLRFILQAARTGRSVASIEQVASLARAAARAGDDVEARHVVEWLRARGRLDDK